MIMFAWIKFRIRRRIRSLMRSRDSLLMRKESVKELLANALDSLPQPDDSVTSNNGLHQQLTDELTYVQKQIDRVVSIIDSSVDHAERELRRRGVMYYDLHDIVKGSEANTVHCEISRCSRLAEKYSRLVRAAREYLLIKGNGAAADVPVSSIFVDYSRDL